LTGRERILAALKGLPHDRIPVTTGYYYEWVDDWKAAEPSYRRLVEFCRANADVLHPWHPKALDEKLFMTSSPDVRVEWNRRTEGEATFLEALVYAPRGILRKVVKRLPGAMTDWTVEHFIKDERDIETFLSIPYEPVHYDCSGWEGEAGRIGDRGVLFPGFGDPLCHAAELFEFGDFTVCAMHERRTFRKLLDFFALGVEDYLRAVLASGTGEVFRLVGPEYATPPYLPPELFGEYVAGYDRPLVALVHSAGKLVRAHCHGRVREALPVMQAMGVDATDPVEPPPSGDVTLEEAFRLTGGRVAMCGNIELRDIELDTPDELERKVREACETGKRWGRFILMPTAEPITVPLPAKLEANFMRFIEFGRKWGA
jgi:uroporphyrinogen-III decarboxylase